MNFSMRWIICLLLLSVSGAVHCEDVMVGGCFSEGQQIGAGGIVQVPSGTLVCTYLGTLANGDEAYYWEISGAVPVQYDEFERLEMGMDVVNNTCCND